MKYNIGDLLIIPFVAKIGVIIDIKHKKTYEIFWQWKDGRTHIIEESEKTIDLWFKEDGGKFGNKHIPVPK